MRVSPFCKSLFLTFITEGAVLVSFFLFYKMIAANFGPEGVGEYSLVKRSSGMILTLLLLGLGVGLPRYIAMASERSVKIAYFRVGAAIAALFAFAFLFAANLLKGDFAILFFGSVKYDYLVLPVSLYIAGLLLHSLVYSYFRGSLEAGKFNSLQIINLAIIPVAVIFFTAGVRMETLIVAIGIAMLVCVIFFILFFIKGIFSDKRGANIGTYRELFAYSIPRCIGDFLYGILLALGPILAVHISSVGDAGYFSIGQSLLISLGSVIGPLGLVLLPKVSSLVAEGKNEIITDNLSDFVGAIIQCSMFICVQMIIFADIIILYWLGGGFLDAVASVRIILTAVVFYAFYNSTVSILNASRVKPLDMINVSIGLATFLLAFGLLNIFKLFSPIIELSIAFAISVWVMGLRAYVLLRSLYRWPAKKDANYFLIALILNGLFAIVALYVKPVLHGALYGLAVFELLAGTFYLFVLWAIGAKWIRQGIVYFGNR